MKITRYKLDSDEGIFEEESETGEWCYYSDVEELGKEVKELKAKIEELEQIPSDGCFNDNKW